MKKLMAIALLAVSLCTALPVTAHATNLQIVAEDGLWGALIGGLIGTATLAFKDKPGDHLDAIYKGTSIGLVCGVAFGVYEISPTFMAYRDPVTKDTTYAFALRMPLK